MTVIQEGCQGFLSQVVRITGREAWQAELARQDGLGGGGWAWSSPVRALGVHGSLAYDPTNCPHLPSWSHNDHKSSVFFASASKDEEA